MTVENPNVGDSIDLVSDVYDRSCVVIVLLCTHILQIAFHNQ